MASGSPHPNCSVGTRPTGTRRTGTRLTGPFHAPTFVNIERISTRCGGTPPGRASFATKYVDEGLLGYDPQGATRVRMSLMPAAVARRLDVRTTPVARRLAFVDDLVRAGYEVHVNLSPVIVHDGWLDDWVAAEVIFLTHDAQLYEVTLGWHPAAEELLWTREWQEQKRPE